MKILIIAVWMGMAGLVMIGQAQVAVSNLPVIEVKTLLPENERPKFPYRVPSQYDPKGKEIHRVFLNCVWPTTAWDGWAEERGIFIMHVVFTNGMCWKVKDGYGQAVMKGLGELKKRYRVNTEQLLVYGMSRGGQFSNYFVTWKPEVVTAWIAGIPGILDRPTGRMRGVPGLVTAGEADGGRYQVGMRFMEQARKYQLPVIWRSYANTAHETGPEFMALSKAFLDYHHERTLKALQGERRTGMEEREKYPFVGDAQEWRYYPVESEEVKAIPEVFRVELPTEKIARLWADPEAMEIARTEDE